MADFLIEKDPLFARINLEREEYQLYEKVYQQLTIDAPRPDLVIYLQASTDVLLSRIENRGIPLSRPSSEDYLERLNEVYSEFFLYYDGAPLLIVNASEIDLVGDDIRLQRTWWTTCWTSAVAATTSIPRFSARKTGQQTWAR